MPRLDGDARERILDKALELFSARGYAATTVRDIANAVGIKAASLYNHFAGKQGMLDALIERETAHMAALVHDAGAIAYPDEDPAAYCAPAEAQLEQLVWGGYEPFFTDERIRLFRRMLAAARYADKRCTAIYQEVFIERPLALQEAIFTRLVSEGSFAPCDTRLAALQFHGPMFMLIEREATLQEARSFCRWHTAEFNKAHRKED